MNDVDQALLDAEKATLLSEQFDTLDVVGDARSEALYVLVRQLLIEVAGLRADLAAKTG